MAGIEYDLGCERKDNSDEKIMFGLVRFTNTNMDV